MPTFLFWNVSANSISDLIVSLTLSNDVDVLVLAECTLNPNDLLVALNQHSSDYQYAPGFCQSLLFFTRFNSQYLTLVSETPRISIRRLALPARNEIILVGAHLPSKMHFSNESQIFQCTELASLIEDEETIAGHRRTIVLGDLNVNPFELGVVATTGLHAVATRNIAAKGARTVQGKSYSFFYNPMWSYFGDRTEGAPSGTYYYEKAESLTYFWNIFDQILIRPDVLDGLANDGAKILTSAGSVSLIDDQGRPDKQNASDHLPVLLTIQF